MKNIKALIIVPVILVLCLYLLFWPNNIDATYEGIQYKLDQTEGTEFQNSIRVEGRISKNLLLEKSFKGYITIGSLETVLPQVLIDQLEDREYRYIEIDLNSSTYAPLVYSFYDPDCQASRQITIGTLYFDGDFKNLVITLVDGDSKWNSKEGWVLAAPTTNRSDALKLSRELTNYDLD